MLYRYATKTLGLKSSFPAITIVIDEKSSITSEVRPSLHLLLEQVNNWFILNGGKEYSLTEKPLKTDQHRREIDMGA